MSKLVLASLSQCTVAALPGSQVGGYCTSHSLLLFLLCFPLLSYSACICSLEPRPSLCCTLLIHLPLPNLALSMLSFPFDRKRETNYKLHAAMTRLGNNRLCISYCTLHDRPILHHALTIGTTIACLVGHMPSSRQ